MANEDADQRRDALLRQVAKLPPESRDELKARLARDREAKRRGKSEDRPGAG